MSSTTRILNIKNPSLYLALFLGMLLGLSAYCYWLIDILPPTSRWILLCTGLISILAALIFLFLIELWLIPRLSALPKPQTWLLVGLSAPIGAFLLFAGTSAWKAPDRYLAFLLPNEKIEISARPSENSSNPDVAIQWFSTRLGSVSFNSIDYQGWQRKGDLLVLANPENNSLKWEGKTGEQVSIVFSSPTHQGIIQISTDGGEETINLASETGKQQLYTHSYPVPFYASRTTVILLGVLDLSALCFLIGLFIFEKRKSIANQLNQSVSALVPREPHWRKKGNQNASRKSQIIDCGIVTGMIVIAILLRGFNLDQLSPLTDEYHHLFAAKSIASGSPIFSATYQRSLFLVTLPVALFFRVFGPTLWAARLPGVLFNAFAIVPLFLLTKKINRPIAILSCMLYATNPWLIAVSRYVREYGYYPFYFYWILYGMIEFYEDLPGDLLQNGWKRAFRPQILSLTAALLLPIVYMVLIDPLSTFRQVSLTYGVFGMFVLIRIVRKSKASIALSALFAILLLGALYGYSIKSGFVSIHDLVGYWLRYFFTNPPQQWYFNRLAIIPMLGFVGAILVALQVHKINIIPSLLFALFSVSLLFYMFFFEHYIQARYLLDVEFWFIPVVAIGLWSIWILLKSVLPGKNLPAAFLSLIILAFSINGSQILLSTFYDNHGYMPITEEYHVDVKSTQAFLRDKVKPGEALISTSYAQYVTFEGASAFGDVYTYNYLHDSNYTEYFSSIIAQHDSGWIILDDQLYDAIKPFPLKTNFPNHKEVNFVAKAANEYIWHWKSN